MADIDSRKSRAEPGRDSHPKLSARDEKDLQALHASVDRLKKCIPQTPYVQFVPDERGPWRPSQSYLRHFLEQTPFQLNEEPHMQYVSFQYRDPVDSCIQLKTLEEVDHHPTSRPTTAMARGASLSGANTPNLGPKKKITLDAYKNKQAAGTAKASDTTSNNPVADSTIPKSKLSEAPITSKPTANLQTNGATASPRGQKRSADEITKDPPKAPTSAPVQPPSPRKSKPSSPLNLPPAEADKPESEQMPQLKPLKRHNNVLLEPLSPTLPPKLEEALRQRMKERGSSGPSAHAGDINDLLAPDLTKRHSVSPLGKVRPKGASTPEVFDNEHTKANESQRPNNAVAKRKATAPAVRERAKSPPPRQPGVAQKTSKVKKEAAPEPRSGPRQRLIFKYKFRTRRGKDAFTQLIKLRPKSRSDDLDHDQDSGRRGGPTSKEKSKGDVLESAKRLRQDDYDLPTVNKRHRGSDAASSQPTMRPSSSNASVDGMMKSTPMQKHRSQTEEATTPGGLASTPAGPGDTLTAKEKAAYWQEESIRLRDQARQMKKAIDKSAADADSTRLALTAVDTYLCFTLSFICEDEARATDKKIPHSRNWASLGGFEPWVIKRCHALRPLLGFAHLIMMVCNAHLLAMTCKYHLKAEPEAIAKMAGSVYQHSGDGYAHLPLELLRSQFQSIWKSGLLNADLALPPVTPGDYSGRFRLPLAPHSEPIEAVRMGAHFLKQFAANDDRSKPFDYTAVCGQKMSNAQLSKHLDPLGADLD